MADLKVIEGRCGHCGQLGFRIVRQGERWQHYDATTMVELDEGDDGCAHVFILGRLELPTPSPPRTPGWREVGIGCATSATLAASAVVSAGLVLLLYRYGLLPLWQWLLELRRS